MVQEEAELTFSVGAGVRCDNMTGFLQESLCAGAQSCTFASCSISDSGRRMAAATPMEDGARAWPRQLESTSEMAVALLRAYVADTSEYVRLAEAALAQGVDLDTIREQLAATLVPVVSYSETDFEAALASRFGGGVRVTGAPTITTRTG